MLGRRLEKLITSQHEEALTRHEEFMTRHEETMVYFKQREKDMREESRQRREEFERLMEASEHRTEEGREYSREILLRNEKVYTGVLVRLEELGEETRSNIEETRAQTQALLRLIDRFDESGGAATA